MRSEHSDIHRCQTVQEGFTTQSKCSIDTVHTYKLYTRLKKYLPFSYIHGSEDLEPYIHHVSIKTLYPPLTYVPYRCTLRFGPNFVGPPIKKTHPLNYEQTQRTTYLPHSISIQVLSKITDKKVNPCSLQRQLLLFFLPPHK